MDMKTSNQQALVKWLRDAESEIFGVGEDLRRRVGHLLASVICGLVVSSS